MRLNDIPNSSGKPRHYLSHYETYFAPLREKPICILELGIDKGGSLLLWHDYFPKAKIAGLDIRPVAIEKNPRTFVFQGNQQDITLLDRIRNTVAPEGFDIVIDDASHIGLPTKTSFWHLFEKHLKPGGVYVIEDWRVSYWDEWVDGDKYRANPTFPEKVFGRLFYRKQIFRSHQFGMVGFLKQLVDELAVDMITHPSRGWTGSQSFPRFAKMEFLPGMVFITKATPESTALLKS
jgi:SAM-dependent methyltransferase